MERSEGVGSLPIPDGITPAQAEAAKAGDAEIRQRSEADEAAADEARVRFRRDGMPMLLPDGRIAPLLLPGERVVATRPAALLERRQPTPGERPWGGIAGSLYVTSRRLVLVGRPTLSFGIGTIEEVLLSGERLLLVFHDGYGVMLQVAQPRLLCVEIAVARASARAASTVQTESRAQPAIR